MSPASCISVQPVFSEETGIERASSDLAREGSRGYLKQTQLFVTLLSYQILSAVEKPMC